MELTNNELVFLNSITKEVPLYGFHLDTPGILNEHTYLDDTYRSLIKNGILDQDKKLTPEGIGVVKIFDMYKTSSKIVQINHYHMSIQKNDKVVIIVKKQNKNYEFLYMNKYDAMYAIITKFDVFRNQRYKENCAEESVRLSTYKFRKNMQNHSDSFFSTYEFNKEGLQSNNVIY